MTTLAFSLELAQDLYNSPEEFPVTFDDAWVWLEFSTKGNAKRSFDKAGFIAGMDFQVFITNDNNPGGGRPTEVRQLTCECFKRWGMMAGTAKGKEVRDYFIQCEKIAKAAIAQQSTMTTADMLLVFAQQFKQNEERMLRLEKINAETQHRLDAIDMETAANTIEIERFSNGHGFWVTIAGWCKRNNIKKPVQWMNIQGRKASALCKRRGLKPVQVKDPRFGYVNSYPDSILAELNWD